MRISDKARAWGARQLLRRAGLKREDTAACIVVPGSAETVILLPGGRARLVFPVEREPDLTKATRVPFLGGSLGGDAVVPFVSTAAGPLFRIDGDTARAAADLPLATLLTLGRWEELDTSSLDAHARFPSEASLAARKGFLERPIVDEWGVDIQETIARLIPPLPHERRVLRAMVSHDVDTVGIPVGKRAPFDLAFGYHKLVDACREVFAMFGMTDPTFIRWTIAVAQVAREAGLQTAVYWMAAKRSARDAGYDVFDLRVKRAMVRLCELDVEQGFHASYETFRQPELLAKELSLLRKATTAEIRGGRQHFLRWAPVTWHHWEACGLQYDSSLGFADQIGFRAGTCWPYRPWLLEEDREANVVEIPLIVMDGTLTKYMQLEADAALSRVGALVARAREVGGVFTLLWHNTSLGDRLHGPLYRPILALLRGALPFTIGDSD